MTSAKNKQINRSQMNWKQATHMHLGLFLGISTKFERSPIRTADTSMEFPDCETTSNQINGCSADGTMWRKLRAWRCSRRNVRALPEITKQKTSDKAISFVMFSLNYIFKI